MPRSLTIEDFVKSPAYLGDTQISDGQMAILKAIYGMAMSESEMAVFLSISEGRKPRRGGYREATVVAGVRSGKTEKILSNAMAYEAFTFRPVGLLAPGELAYVPIIAQDRTAGMDARNMIEGKLQTLEERGYDVFERREGQSKAVTGQEIRLANRVVIKCFACNKASVRGKTCIAGGADEMAYWQTEPDSYNADYEVQRALRSRFATMSQRYRFIKISSPFAESGVLWDDYQARSGSHRLFVQAPSWVLNPSLSEGFLADERAKDAEAFLREYGAQVGKPGGSFLAAVDVDRAMRDDRPLALPPRERRDYRAAMDAAFKRDLFAFGIAHREGERAIFDVVRWWKPEKRRPLNETEVIAECAALMKQYGVDAVIGDQFSDVPIQRDFEAHGIRFQLEAQTAAGNHEMFKNLKGCLKRGLIELPPDEMIRKDLLSLVARPLPSGGLIRVAAPSRAGFHDDISKVVAALALKLLPMTSAVDIAALNSGAIDDRTRLLKERGFTVPEREDSLPTDFMSRTF